MRGGNFKFRALRLDSGNFSWGSEVSSARACATFNPMSRYEDSLDIRSLPEIAVPAEAINHHVTTVHVVQAVTRKTRVLDVVYNASNNELVGYPLPSLHL